MNLELGISVHRAILFIDVVNKTTKISDNDVQISKKLIFSGKNVKILKLLKCSWEMFM